MKLLETNPMESMRFLSCFFLLVFSSRETIIAAVKRGQSSSDVTPIIFSDSKILRIFPPERRHLSNQDACLSSSETLFFQGCVLQFPSFGNAKGNDTAAQTSKTFLSFGSANYLCCFSGRLRHFKRTSR